MLVVGSVMSCSTLRQLMRNTGTLVCSTLLTLPNRSRRKKYELMDPWLMELTMCRVRLMSFCFMSTNDLNEQEYMQSRRADLTR